MYRIVLAALDILPAAVVLVPLFGVLFVSAYNYDLRRTALSCLFCLYLAAVYSLVGIPNVVYIRAEVNLNLVPFVGMIDDLKNSILNVLLFVPLGFFLPVLWKQFRKMGCCLIFGFGFSLAIELLQMLTYRTTDVNDLITNVCGTLVGYLLAKPLMTKILPAGKGKGEPFVLCGLSFLVMFLVHPFLSPIIWDRIL